MHDITAAYPPRSRLSRRWTGRTPRHLYQAGAARDHLNDGHAHGNVDSLTGGWRDQPSRAARRSRSVGLFNAPHTAQSAFLELTRHT